MPCKIISLAQQKGGVGKTTTVINLGSALAQRGKKILLVDLDPQGALSAGLGLNPLSLEKTIYNVLRNSSVSLAEIITQSKTGCDLVPANIDLAAAEVELVSEPGREHFLREALSSVIDRYDYILIDCQPSLGLLTLNALSASSGVIIPVQTQYFALRGMDLLFQTIEKVQARLNPKLKIVGILPTMYDARTIHAREVLEELKRTYPKLILSAVVPHTIKFADSSMAGDSVLSLNPDSQAAEAYRELATEVEKRV